MEQFSPLPAAELIHQFQRDGAIVLRGAFKGWVEPLREGTAQLMADPSPLERSHQPKDGSAPFFQDLCNWQRIPHYRRFVIESGAGRIAAALMHRSEFEILGWAMEPGDAVCFHFGTVHGAPGNVSKQNRRRRRPIHRPRRQGFATFQAPPLAHRRCAAGRRVS
jgi:ectoine hydroxylase-related dioxygenase (phytanoyl-CoA dioxygenase family)